MLTPEAVCEKINKIKASERLEDFLDQIDLQNKIDENSHSLRIKRGMYVGATLLLCALTKYKMLLVKKLIEKAKVGSIDVYVALKETKLTVISFIPDYLMCEVIQKAKVIDINLNWKSSNILLEVIAEGHYDILMALLQKGLVDLELFNACVTDNEINKQLKININDAITCYLKAVRFFRLLPNQPSFNNLLDLFSQYSWLLDVCQPNSEGATFKEQVITRLNLVNKHQLREFYNRFPQFKPHTESHNNNADYAPAIVAITSDNPALTLQSLKSVNDSSNTEGSEHGTPKSAIVAIKKEFSLQEILHHGKTKILKARLQKGEIKFESLEFFSQDNKVSINCKEIIDVCLGWRALTFDLPKQKAFEDLLILFEQNSWLLKVRESFEAKSLYELTFIKLKFKKSQLDKFTEKFPEQQQLSEQIIDQSTNGEPAGNRTPNDVAGDESEPDEQLLADTDTEDLSTLSSGVANSDATNNNPEKQAGVSTQIANVPADVSISSQFAQISAQYLSAYAEGGTSTSLVLQHLVPKQALQPPTIASDMNNTSIEEITVNEEHITAASADSSSERASGSALQPNPANQRPAVNALTSQFTDAITSPSSNNPNLVNPIEQAVQEKKKNFKNEIYNKPLKPHDKKQELITQVQSTFQQLIIDHKNETAVNEQNHNKLLDALCDLFNDINETEHKKKINIHDRSFYDWFFRKPNTQSWQDMVKIIRDESLVRLFDIAQSLSNPAKAITFLNIYVNEPLFGEHRSNVAICRIGFTSSAGKIKDKIKKYEDMLPKSKNKILKVDNFVL